MKILARILHHPRLGLIILAYVAFIALGMPDGLLGVAWPTIRHGFGIPLDALGLFLALVTTGYLISSFSSGMLITRFGVGRVLTASCALTGAGLISYTLVPQWSMMVVLGIAAGLGAGAIDAGLNTYVATHLSAGMMQWLHASYGIGVTLGPLIMTFALSTLNTWRTGYRIVGGFQILLALSFLLTLPMWSTNNSKSDFDNKKRITDYRTSILETLKQPPVWLSMLLFLLYVGAEATLGVWTFSLLTESRGIETQAAGFWAGSYWATFTIGRIFAGLYARKVSINKIVLVGFSGALAGALLLLWNPTSWSSLVAVALIGFSIAPIFPALTSATSQRVKPRYTANTIGMQMAAGGLGATLIPGLMGVIARQISLEVIPASLIIIFAVLLGLSLFAGKISSTADTKIQPSGE